MNIAELDEAIEEWKNDHKVILDDVEGLHPLLKTKLISRKKLDALINTHYWALVRSCLKSKEDKELFAVFGQDTLLTAEGRISWSRRILVVITIRLRRIIFSSRTGMEARAKSHAVKASFESGAE